MRGAGRPRAEPGSRRSEPAARRGHGALREAEGPVPVTGADALAGRVPGARLGTLSAAMSCDVPCDGPAMSPAEPPTMKPVELCRILHSDQTPECHMYLRDKESGRVFPVIIAMNEMAEIHRKVHSIATRRPMTHDIFRALMQEVGATLDSVHITELKDDVFYASMHFHLADGRRFEIDARPSDAVAIATGAGAQLYASEKILADIGIVEAETEGEAEGGNGPAAPEADEDDEPGGGAAGG